MRLALAQINPVVGELAGNRALILERLEEAKDRGADLVLFPELAVTGYPPEDLLLRPGFVRAAERSLEEIARSARGTVAVVGTPHFDRDLFNAAAVCAGGEVKALVKKRFLPNYGVFDEFRYFAPGDGLYLFEHGDVLVGATICEDMWQPGPPATDLSLAGAELIVNISASPFHLLRDREREEMFRTRARDNSVYVAFCNTVGGQDELIFDGHSLVIDDEGTVIARAPGFEEALLVVDVDPSSVLTRRLTDGRRRALAQDRGDLGPVPVIHVGAPRPAADGAPAQPPLAPFCGELEQMRIALELGLSDYVRKNGFHEVIVSVSGGIDSALVAALAAESLGPERVHCVSLPSRYSSEATRRDGQQLAEGLGCDFREIGIEPIVEASLEVLAPSFAGREPDLTEENLQARIRATLVMALSNKFGGLLVATGNKSELSVGYATLYGDMAGGFALLKDVFKTDVFRLAKHLNERAGRDLIPQSIVDRALEAYVEQDRSLEELAADGFDADVVARAVAMIDRAEYKRRQAPPGVRLHPKAFGRDRRTPITNHWRS